MSNKTADKAVENTNLNIEENSTQKTIEELKSQVDLLTKMITSQAQKNEEAEKAFFKKKTVVFTVTTFREPNKQPDVKEITVKS